MNIYRVTVSVMNDSMDDHFYFQDHPDIPAITRAIAHHMAIVDPYWRPYYAHLTTAIQNWPHPFVLDHYGERGTTLDAVPSTPKTFQDAPSGMQACCYIRIEKAHVFQVPNADLK